MAYLPSEDVIKILKEKKTPDELARCIAHDNRAFFHTEPELSKDKLTYYPEFSSWVRKILHSEKHKVFEHLNTCPVATVDFTESTLKEFKKIFEAQDRYVNYLFKTEELEKDAIAYLNSLYYNDFWVNDGFSAMCSSINSLIIVDIPQQQNSKYPEPYFYLLKPEYVVSYDYTDKFEWVITRDRTDDRIYYQFDSHSYKVFNKNDKGDYTFVSEAKHDLGYTPVTTFWDTPFNSKSKIQRRSPISNALGKLDYLLFWCVSQNHSTLYSGFPITVMYEQKCGYEDTDGVCENGVIHYLLNDERHTKKCPVCSTRDSILGAGQTVKAPNRSSNEDPDMIDGIKHVGAEVSSLEFLQKFIKAFKAEIQFDICGFVPEGAEAMNEKQVLSYYDSRYSALLEVKRNFERTDKWTVDTLLKLRYGSVSFVGSTVNYGTKFFLFDVDQLTKFYNESKNSGMPNYDLENQVQQIIFTKYKNNPDMLERLKILSALEPYQGYTLDDIIKIKNLDPSAIDATLLKIKINFNSYVQKFEREIASVTSYMPEAELNKKVTSILKTLIEYATQNENGQINRGIENPPIVGGDADNDRE